jgi:AraC-like DNA-binding protein
MSEPPEAVRIAKQGNLRVQRCLGQAGPLSAELRAGWVTAWSAKEGRVTTPQFAVVWFLRGTGTLTDASGATWPLEPGVVFHRLPDHELRVRSVAAAQWCYLALPAAMRSALLRIAPAAPAVFRVPPEAGLLRRWRQAARFLRSCPDCALPVAAAELFALVAELHQRGASTQDDPWANLACSLLENAPNQPGSLTAVAAEMGLSPSGFRARFIRSLGLSPRDWQQRRRMARAQDLLSAPGATVAQVSEALGYADAPAFAKAFRAVVGISPAAWRQQSA